MPPFADVSFSTESVVAIGALLAALASAVGYVFRLLIKAKDDQIALALEKSEKKSYQQMLEEALAIIETRIATKLADKPGVKPLAAVVPESSSPPTPEQKSVAELQTARAKLTAAALALGVPPREAGKPPGSQRTPAGVVAEQLREDIAEVPQKVVDKIKEEEQSPPEVTP